MKVLVVGGAGYVGCVLVPELLERGYKVRVFDRLYFGNNLPESVDLVVGDMRNVPSTVFDGIDAVINMGGLSNDPTAEMWPEANRQINTLATKKLAEDCKRYGISKFLFASTCSIYDRNDDKICDELTVPLTLYPYSSSKYEAEIVLRGMADENFCPVILRKGTIYGYSPRMRYDLVVNTFVAHALTKGVITIFGGGEMWRPLIDVRDVARAYITCLEADEDIVRGHVFNVSYCNFRISELAFRVQCVLAQKGRSIEIHADYTPKKIRSYRVSTDKIYRMLGFEATISVEDSVGEMYDKLANVDDPKGYNIRWMQILEEAKKIIDYTGDVF